LPTFARLVADPAGRPRPLRFEFSPGLPVPITRYFVEVSSGSPSDPGVQLLVRDADLRAEAELAAVGNGRGLNDHGRDHRAVNPGAACERVTIARWLSKYLRMCGCAVSESTTGRDVSRVLG